MLSETSQPPAPPARLFARLNPGVTLERNAAGGVSALFDGRAVEFGKFGADVAERVAEFETGVAFDGERDGEIRELVRRLALYGLVEYRLARAPSGPDLIVVEPQMRDYAPRMIEIDEDRLLALSRFAYIRRRGADMVLEIAARMRALSTVRSQRCSNDRASVAGAHGERASRLGRFSGPRAAGVAP